MVDDFDGDILVVGLGPVGAVLTGLLGQAGLRVLAIDKSLEIYPLPRAAHFDHEIMRVFQQLGIVDEVLEHTRAATAYEFRAADGRVLVRFDRMDELTPLGWCTSYMFNQPGVERAIRDRLAADPRIEMRLGHAFADVRQHPDSVSVDIAGPEGSYTVKVAYVVGCDGAWSPVREATGSALEDYSFDEPWLVVDTLPRPGSRPLEVNLQICDPARPTTCVQMGPGRHRWEFMLLPGEQPEDVLADKFVEALLAPWEVDVAIERKAVYRFHGLIAERWRDGRLLIAGDAAHQMPPFAGQGMCSGIRDGANLAWKLASVIQQNADDAILDSYQREREPNVRSYIGLAIEMGRVVCTLDPDVAAARDAKMSAALEAGVPALPPVEPPVLTGPYVLEATAGAGRLFPQPVARRGEKVVGRLDDQLGPGAWLIVMGTAPQGATTGLTVVQTNEERLASFRTALEGWLARHGAVAVLVRPDRIVFGTGDAVALADAWASALATPEMKAHALA